MKQIVRRAGCQALPALILLMVCELTNAINGLILGAALFGNWSVGPLMPGFGLVMGRAIYVRIRPDHARNHKSRHGYKT